MASKIIKLHEESVKKENAKKAKALKAHYEKELKKKKL